MTKATASTNATEQDTTNAAATKNTATKETTKAAKTETTKTETTKAAPTPEELEAIAQEEAERDAEALAMAQALGMDESQANEDDDSQADFDPSTVENLTPEQEAQMLQGTQDMLQTSEGAEMAAIGAINWYEELLQEHGHERFTITDKKKLQGAKRLTPVIQKYAPDMLGLFGQYKSEVMAALFVGSMAYGSVKQIKALKSEDLAEDKRLHPEKYNQDSQQQQDAPQQNHAQQAAQSPQSSPQQAQTNTNEAA